MAKPYSRMSKSELIRELQQRDQDRPRKDVAALVHELEVHQEEIRVQNAQLVEAQRALEETAARYVDLYENAPIPYVTLDDNGLISEINLTGSKFLKGPRLSVVGIPFIHVVAPAHRERFLEHVRRYRATASIVTTELDLTTQLGGTIPVELATQKGRSSAEHVAYRSAIFDLTQRKRIESELIQAKDDLERRVQERTRDLLEAVGDLEMEIAERAQLARQLREQAEKLKDQDRRKDEFLAMLGHELRNPLAPIHAALQILKSKDSAQYDHQRARAVIERQIDHLVKLIDDLLDVSRISRGKIQIHKEPVLLGEIISRAVEAVLPAIDGAHHQLSVQAVDPAAAIDADPVRMTQVITNLLQNAVKYTPAGGTIDLVARRMNGTVEFRVKDSGIGIAPEMMPKVFDLFFQGDQSIDRSKGGLGLGLALARRLVEMHGGTLEGTSRGRGQGSEFVVRMPALPAGVPVAAAPSEDDRTPDPRRRRVLVVDDNIDAADALAAVLESEGHEVRTAYAGDRALQIAREFDPEIVLLDIGLPAMDGYEVAKKLREDHPGGSLILIAVTGYGEPEARRRSQEAGFNQHLLKPLRLDTIHRVMGEASARLAAPAPAAH